MFEQHNKSCEQVIILFDKDKKENEISLPGFSNNMHKIIFVLESFECPEYFFKCPDSFCVERRFVCDGIVHCENGDDELDCSRFSMHTQLNVT